MSDPSMNRRLSIILPAFNEAQNLPELIRRLFSIEPVLSSRGVAMEVVIIDDHSSDATPEVAKQLVASHPHITYARLSRNCGSHLARAAGLERCTGDAAVDMAADLQDPPELIPALVATWCEGTDVVWAVRSRREGERWSTLLSSRLFYALMRRWAMPDLPPRGADYFIVSRRVIDAYNAMQEKDTNINLAIRWLGFRQTSIDYVKQARHAGRSGFTLAKKIQVALDSIVSYSVAPVRLVSLAGLWSWAIGGACIAVAAAAWLLGLPTAIFWSAAVAAVLLLLQGMTLLSLGIVGEYVCRTLHAARGRPRYLIEDSAASTSENP
jgi:dolichol-phosphate mannosyltransferase